MDEYRDIRPTVSSDLHSSGIVTELGKFKALCNTIANEMEFESKIRKPVYEYKQFTLGKS